MMEDMKEKGLKEKNAETAAFKTFTQLFQDTMAAKEKTVADAYDEIDKLSADIERYDSDAALLGREITKLDAAADRDDNQNARSTEKFHEKRKTITETCIRSIGQILRMSRLPLLKSRR